MTPVLRYVLDENLRGVLWQAIQHHNSRSAYPPDAVRVGDPPDLPLGTQDPDVLVWAEREGRIFVSLDKKMLPGHLAQHLQQGRHSPGIFIVISSSRLTDILDYLTYAAYAGDPLDYADAIRFIP
jgi:hypothetical protein